MTGGARRSATLFGPRLDVCSASRRTIKRVNRVKNRYSGSALGVTSTRHQTCAIEDNCERRFVAIA